MSPSAGAAAAGFISGALVNKMAILKDDHVKCGRFRWPRAELGLFVLADDDDGDGGGYEPVVSAPPTQ